MNRPKATLALVLCVFVTALVLGCDSETTAPERPDPAHDDPVDWDGDKDGWTGNGPAGALSNAPSLRSATGGLTARDRLLGFELEAHDHTLIMEAILGNAPEIVARLPQGQVSSGKEVLRATLAVPGIDAYTKSRIRLVLDWLTRLEQVQDQIPNGTLQAVAEVMTRLEAYPTVAGKIEALQHMIDSGQYDVYDGLPQGMATGIGILRDGEKTIYAPRCFLSLKRLVQQDLQGAVAGAIGGLIVAGPPGAGVGAVVGAAGASGSDIVGQLTGWW